MVAVRGDCQALDISANGLCRGQLGHNLQGSHIHHRQILRSAQYQVEEASIWRKGHMVHVVWQGDFGSILLNGKVNQAQRLGAERRSQGVSAVGGDGYRPDCAIGDVDAVADLGRGNVQGVEGEGRAKVQSGIVGADDGRSRYTFQLKGAQNVAKGEAFHDHVNFMNGAAAANVADIEARAGMVDQQAIRCNQRGANRVQDVACAQVDDLHILGGGVEDISLRVVSGVSHVVRAGGHRVTGDGFPGANRVAGDQVFVFVGHQKFRAGMVEGHALGINTGRHSR